MAYKDYRINTKINSGEKYLKVNLKRGIDTFKILSLTINTEDTYQYPSADYGVIVGRVLANNAFGVPNVKVSVFVSLSSDDEDDELLSQIYPFKTVNSKDDNNVGYNLIQTNPYSGIDGLHTTTGTFPSKRLVLDNDTVAKAYDKYWEYTTVTNESGDYMIFGVPTGNCQVHFDCDLSDVGLISQRPYDFINKGYSAELFKSATEFKDDDVTNAVQILSQDTTVFVYPFWGDKEQNQIGITRNDLNLNYTFEPSCIFLGSSITDPDGTYFSTYGQPVGSNGRFRTLATSAGNIEIIRKTEEGYVEELTENVKGIIDGNGVWCYSIPMNLDRIGTDEEGNIVPINKPDAGIPTRARMRMRITLTSTEDSVNGITTAKILIPNNPPLKPNTFGEPIIDTSKLSNDDLNSYYEFGTKTPDVCFRDFYWGKVYSVKQYIPRIQYDNPYHNAANTALVGLTDYSGYPIKFSHPFSCISSIDSIQGFNPFPYTTMYAGAENWSDTDTHKWFREQLTEYSSNNGYTEKGLHFCFENDWINGCLYFPKCKIIQNYDNSYTYFGDVSSWEYRGGKTFGYITYTGRHNTKIEGSTFTTRQADVAWRPWHYGWYRNQVNQSNDQDNTSIYSHVKITNGILHLQKNSLNQSIFYYRSGKEENQVTGGIWEIFYASDIILLGNLVDIYDSLPKLYQNLPVTTATFPPLVPPKSLSETGMNKNGYTRQLEIMYHDGGYDTDNVDIFGNFNEPASEANVINHKNKNEDYSNIDKYDETIPGSQLKSECIRTVEYKNESGGYSYYYADLTNEILDRFALFFGYKVANSSDSLYYFIPTFVNTSRICELDVHNNQFTKSAYRNYDGLAINGTITRRDISSNENRSSFASMNYDITNYNIEPKTNHRKFSPKNLEIVDFDGRLKKYLNIRKFDAIDEELDKSYVLFRYGNITTPMRYWCTATEGIFVYDGTDSGGIENNGDLPLPVNSFYFYFGLRSGLSALDKFNEKYGIKSSNEELDISDYISVDVSNDGSCGDGMKTYTTTFTINSNLEFPYSVKIKKGTNTVYSSANRYSTSFSVSLSEGIYSITITDNTSVNYTKRFTVQSQPIQLETKTNYDTIKEKYTLQITQIDSNSNSDGLPFELKTVGNISGLTYSASYKWYFVWFDESFELIKDGTKTIIATVNSGTTFSGHISEYNNLYDNPCQTDQFYIKFGNPNATTFKFCDVPIEVIPEWDTSKTLKSERAYNYKNSQKADSYNFTGGYVESEQMSYVSKMVNAIYCGGQMGISYDTELLDYTPNVITPKVNLLKDAIYNFNDWDTYAKDCSGNEKSQKVVIETPIADDSIVMPHIIGQNYPISYNTKTLLKTAKGGGYSSNNHYRINDGSNSYLVNHNYFGFIQADDSNKDRPSGLNVLIRSLSEVPNVNWKDSDINSFSVQTVDKRLDYSFVIKTPSVLPSGYDKFTSLSGKCVSVGSINASIYGGLRLNKDGSNNITCYKFNSSKNTLSGCPDSNATLFSQSITEDGTVDLSPYITKRHIWNDDYNDEINIVSNVLSGNTGLYINLNDCGNFDNGVVQVGKNLNISISYSPGATLIQKDNISTDDYDVLYDIDTYSSSYVICGSFSGSSLSFKLSSDNLYTGVTYTDINTKAWNNYGNSYDYNGLGSNPKSLCVFVNNKSYEVNSQLTSNATNYDGLKYDANVCYYPIYGADNTPLPDSEAQNCYTFNIESTNDKFPEIATITIPTRKLYQERGESLLKQGVIYNTGYSYYASRLAITQISETNMYIELYSPLSSPIKFDEITNLNGYTIGEITWSCDDAENVTYNYEYHRFELTLKTGLVGKYITLYFVMKNGLKYKVHAPINPPNIYYAVNYSKVNANSGDTLTVTSGGTSITSGTNVLRGSLIKITTKADTNRLVELTVNGVKVDISEEGQDSYEFNVEQNSTIVATFSDKPATYDIPGDVILS